MIRILLVDDQQLVRIGIEALINAANDMTVVGIAQTGEEAINVVELLDPDVVIMDIKMPGIGGVEACRRILRLKPDAKIIAISNFNSDPTPAHLLKIGVMGFLSKDSSLEEMNLAIRKVMTNSRYICTEVANSIAMEGIYGTAESPFAKLSQRETEVVRLILKGRNIQEMANMLTISDKTINTYRYRLYEKLNIKNDVELTLLAIKFGFMED